MNARQKLGQFGERLAIQRLEADGVVIVATNVRVKAGEIDIIGRQGQDLVFVEVRTRRAAPGMAGESLSDAKLERMWQCAIDYCIANDVDPETLRLDAVTVEIAANGTVVGVDHMVALELPG